MRMRPGVLALIAAAASMLTGVFLSFNYAATWEAAHTSVQHLQDELTLGWMLRGIHYWGAVVSIALALVEGARLFWRGDYQRPHHRLWLLGIALATILVGFAYTGYLLAGDQRAYAGVLVLEGVLRSTPLIGNALALIVIGGDSVSSATLARIYTMHVVVLPATLLLVTVALVRVRGGGKAGVVRAALARDPITACALVLLLVGLAYQLPAALGEPGGPGAPAAEHARPEWFFLWVNELLFRVQGSTFLVAAVLPGALLAGALLLPWLRRGDPLPASGRRPELIGGSVVAVVLVTLSVMSIMRPAPAEEEDDDDDRTPLVIQNGGEDPEYDERLSKTLRRFRCVRCHVIADDPDGGEDGPPLPLGREFGELYTRRFFREKVADPREFWADSGMTYPKDRKPTPEELAMLEKYFFGD